MVAKASWSERIASTAFEISLSDIAPVNPEVLRFINRISDLFFVLGRYNNIMTGTEELFWEK